MLTKKQHQLLLFIKERLDTVGVAPSFDEMKEALNLKSKSGIHRLISALEERGFLRRLPHRARALEILKIPETGQPDYKPSVEEDTDVEEERDDATVIHPDFQAKSWQSPTAAPSSDENVVDLPLHGRIAAGTPIEALQDNGTTVSVPGSMITGGDHYALQVSGDSMLDAGICDGDTILIRRTDTADNGDIVVALIDDQEATLKRLRRKGGSVALEAANPAYETRIFGPDRVKVQGRLVGLFRRY